jgi:hypothetical protein
MHQNGIRPGTGSWLDFPQLNVLLACRVVVNEGCCHAVKGNGVVDQV